MPLRCRGAILQSATASGGVAPQLPRDRRRRPSDPTRYPLYSAALHPQERNLLAFSKRKISSRLQLRRPPKHCWWHSACLSKPPRSDRLRDVAGGRSIFSRQACRNRPPKPSQLITPCRWWSTWRGQWSPTRTIGSPFHLVIVAPHE